MSARTTIDAFLWTSLAVLTACNRGPDGLGGASFGSGYGGAADDGGDDTAGSSEAADPDSGSGDGDGTGVGSDSGDDEGAVDGSSSGDPTLPPTTDPTAADDGPDSAGADIGECSNFTSVDQLHAWLNTERQQYAGGFGGLGHDRYKGLPWQGEFHTSSTFSVQFAWDDNLAAAAQAEAEALASGGGSPQGNQSNGSNGLPFCPAKPFWIDGINTSSWKITFGETATDWMAPPEHPDSCPPPFALSADNQHARMGLLYHDFGGDGPAIHSVGIGAAADADCQVWWVLQFGT